MHMRAGHWELLPLFLLALFLLALSAVGTAMMNRRRKTRQTLLKNLRDLVYDLSASAKNATQPLDRKPTLGEIKTMPWGGTLVQFVKSSLTSWGRWVRSVRNSHGGRAGATKYSTVVFCAAICGLAVMIGGKMPAYPIEEYHNLYVWSQVKGTNDAWWIGKDSFGLRLWKCCPDYPCDRVIWPGYVMRDFRYEERGGCKSIRGATLGVVWQRDEQGNVKETP